MIDKSNRRIQLIASVNSIPILHQIAFALDSHFINVPGTIVNKGMKVITRFKSQTQSNTIASEI